MAVAEDDDSAVPIKVVVVGDRCAGKSALLDAAATGTRCAAKRQLEDESAYIPTVVDHVAAAGCITEGPAEVPLALFECGGDRSADGLRLRRCIYPSTRVAVVVFDVLDPSSFDAVRALWAPEIRANARGVPWLLVGTHADLRVDQSAVALLRAQQGKDPVSPARGDALARDLGAYRYVECSSVTLDGVADVLRETIAAVRAHESATDSSDSGPPSPGSPVGATVNKLRASRSTSLLLSTRSRGRSSSLSQSCSDLTDIPLADQPKPKSQPSPPQTQQQQPHAATAASGRRTTAVGSYIRSIIGGGRSAAARQREQLRASIQVMRFDSASRQPPPPAPIADTTDPVAAASARSFPLTAKPLVASKPTVADKPPLRPKPPLAAKPGQWSNARIKGRPPPPANKAPALPRSPQEVLARHNWGGPVYKTGNGDSPSAMCATSPGSATSAMYLEPKPTRSRQSFDNQAPMYRSCSRGGYESMVEDGPIYAAIEDLAA